MRNSLPQGWAFATVAEVIEGAQPGFASGKKDVEGGIAQLRMNNIGTEGRLVLDLIRSVPKKLAKPHYDLQMGDVLVCTTNSGKLVGKCSYFNLSGRFVFSNHLTRLRPRSDMADGSFLHWSLWLNWRSGEFDDKCKHWVNQSTIPKDILLQTRLRLPPLVEQRRIAAKLETLLTKVDLCQQRLAKIPVLLKRFRQAILTAACSGRLTTDWRKENPNIECSFDLTQRIQIERRRRYDEEVKRLEREGRRKPKRFDSASRSRNVVRDLPELPESWSYIRLEELCHLVTDGTHKTPKYQTAGVPFLSVRHVRPFIVRDNDHKFIQEEEHRWINARCNPEKGDLLYTKIGATFGYAAINELDYPFSIFVSLALLKPVNPLFCSSYAEVVMNSEIIFSQARDRVTGIGTPDLHLIEIRDFRTPLPPVAEQREIVRRVKSLFSLCCKIEARYEVAKTRVDKLTQAILAKAFRGELVTTEAEMADAEGQSYESAGQLLQRMGANSAEMQLRPVPNQGSQQKWNHRQRKSITPGPNKQRRSGALLGEG